MNQQKEILRTEIKRLIALESEKAVDILTELWTEMFEGSNVQEHLRKLPFHVKTFYGDVIAETKSREESIIADIAKLQLEARTLQELLKTDHLITVDRNGKSLAQFQIELDASLNEMRNEVARRKEFMQEFKNEYEVVCSELEEEYDVNGLHVPSESEMDALKLHLQEMQQLKQQRLTEMGEIRLNINEYTKNLEIVLDDEQQTLLSISTLGLSHMKHLHQLQEDLKQKFNDMTADMNRMMKKISRLWNLLEVEPLARIQGILEQPQGYNHTNHCHLLEELQRCETMKQRNIEQCIRKIRNELVTMWDICHISQTERDRFNAFAGDKENLLNMLETELYDQKMHYEKHKDIFSLLEEWSQLWTKMKEHDVKSCDPNRFNNRGGQLLKEEKERRALYGRLPKVEAQILEICAAYEDTHGRPFTVYSQRMKDFIEGEHEKRDNEKKHFKVSFLQKVDGRTIRDCSLVSEAPAVKATPLNSSNRSQHFPNATQSHISRMNGTQAGDKREVLTVETENTAVKRRSLTRQSLRRESVKRTKLNEGI